MKKILAIAWISTWVFASCSSNVENANVIDYTTLDEIPVEVTLEISETEEYLPGRLQDLVVTSDGSMLVSDWASVTIEQFDAAGSYVGRVAEEGGGPGELSNFFSVIDLNNDTLLVREQSGKKSFFAESGNGLYDHISTISGESIQNMDRYFSVVGARADGLWFARAGNIIRNIQQASKNEDDYRLTPLAVINAQDEVLEDSVQMLKSPTGHISQVNGGIMVNSVPYRYTDRFLLLNDDRYLMAHPDSSAFFIYGKDHELDQRIAFKVKDRPVTSDDLDYALQDVNSRVRDEVRNRVHDFKPPYLNVWASENYLWIHTDNSKEGKEMVVADFEGNPLGKFLLSEHDNIQHFQDDRMYTLHKNPDLGDSIRIYHVSLP